MVRRGGGGSSGGTPPEGEPSAQKRGSPYPSASEESTLKSGTVKQIIQNAEQVVTTTQAQHPGSTVSSIAAASGLTEAQVLAIINSEVTGTNQGLVDFIDTSGTRRTVADAWDYLRNAVEDVFTGIESNLESITTSSFADGTDVSLVEIGAGTTADIAAIEPVGFAFALLLGEYVTGWLLTKIAEVFPNPSLFGWHPLGFIRDGVAALGNQFESSAKGLGETIAGPLIQPIRQLVGLFQRVTNATASAHNKVARVVTHTIPDSLKGLEQQAQQYVDQQVKVIDGAAQQAVASLTPPPTEAEARQIIAEAAGRDSLVWAFAALAATAIVSTDEYARSLFDQTGTDITTAVGDAEQKAKDAIAALQRSLVTQLSTDEATLSAIATTVNTTIPAEIATKVNQAVATENQQLTAASTTLSNQIAALQAQVTAATAAIQANEQAIAAAQANIAQLQQAATVDEQAIATEQQAIATAQLNIATEQQAITSINTQITAISNTLAPIHAAQQLNTAQLAPFEAPGAIALPAALAAISLTLHQLKTKVDTCTVDTCDPNSPNNIRNVLKDLLGLLTAGAEIGFIAEAIRDPLGTANALAPILETVDSSAVATLDALLSL